MVSHHKTIVTDETNNLLEVKFWSLYEQFHLMNVKKKCEMYYIFCNKNDKIEIRNVEMKIFKYLKSK